MSARTDFNFFKIYFPLPGKSATHMLQPQTQSNPVLPWTWRLIHSFETLATTHKTIRRNSPEYHTLRSYRPEDLKYVKQVLFLYERFSVYTPTRMVWHVFPVFSCRFQHFFDTRNENAKRWKATANGPMLTPIALQHLAPNREKSTNYSDEECGDSGVGPFFVTINDGVSVAVR
jgi:hypothetical protein